MTRTTTQDATPARARHRPSVLAAACAIALAAVPAHAAQARLGDLDPSFGDGGIALPKLATSATLRAVAVRPDGRPVAAGWASDPEGLQQAVVVQSTSGGTPDDTFGAGGVARLPPGTVPTRLHAVALDPFDRVLVAGDQQAPSTAATVPIARRFSAEGKPDDTFIGMLAQLNGEARAVLPHPDGGVLVAGWRTGRSTEFAEFFVAKLDDKGALDLTFGTHGVAETTFGGDSRALAMAMAPGGDIVLAGRTTATKTQLPALARFNSDGTPEKGFDEDGQLILLTDTNPDGKPATELRAVAVDAAGLITAAGVAPPYGFVTRRLAGGAPDFTFGTGGATYGAPLGDVELNALTLDGGRAVVAGRAAPADLEQLLLGSLDAGGTPEPALGGDPPGWRSVPAPEQAIAYGVAQGPAGTVYTAGAASAFPFVTRHLPNAAPTAALAAPAQVEAGAPATFDAAGSSDPEGEALRYAFDLDGDGSYEFDAGQNPLALHSFPTPGMYTVGVEVRDPRGGVATAARDVVATAAPSGILAQPPAQPVPAQPVPAQPVPAQLVPAQLVPAQPVLGKQGVAVPLRGIVRYRLPGTNVFLPLTGLAAIPNGTEIDARKGRLLLTVLHDASGRLDAAEFFSGQFIFSQGAGAVPITTLALSGGSFRAACRATAQGGARALLAVAASVNGGKRMRSKKPVRKLWGDGRGRFRTKGRYGAATVRGTKWLTQDRCDGTRVRVVHGKVSVADLVRAGRRPKLLRAGEQTIVRKPGG